MKRLATLVATLVLLATLGGTPTVAGEKVTLCHAAGLEGTTQYVTLTVGYPAAYGPAGHFYENGTQRAGHEQDYLGPCVNGTIDTPPDSPDDIITPIVAPPVVLRYSGYIAGPCGDPRIKFAIWNRSEVAMQFKIRYVTGKYAAKKIVKKKILTVRPWAKKFTPWLWVKGQTTSTLFALDDGRWVVLDRQWNRKSKPWGTYACKKNSRSGL